MNLYTLTRISRCLFTTAYLSRNKLTIYTPLIIRVSNKTTSLGSPIFCVRKMSQTSIRAFFSATPKRSEKKTNDMDEKAQTNEAISNGKDETPPSNAKRKTSKRTRSQSSENESSPINSPVIEKKKLKRQRIESSDSETESSPNCQDNLRSDKPLRTYESPKNLFQKIEKPLNGNKIKTSNKIKSENSTLKIENSKELSPKKTEKKSPITSKKVKEEKLTPVKTDIKENGVKEEKSDAAQVVAETDYNPAKTRYHPVNDACWTKGQDIPYLALAKTLEAIEATSSRLKMIDILSNYLRSVIALTPEDLLPSIYMCLNQLGPAYQGLELGMAETYIMKAVGQCTGRTVAQLRAAARSEGDLGIVAERARASQRTMMRPAPLRLRNVHAALRQVANMTGQASVNKKISKIQSLYVACRQSEARYLIRSLEGKLRIGLAELSVLQALGAACAATPPAGRHAGELDVSGLLNQQQYKARVDECALTIKTTYCECPNYDLIVPALLTHGVEALPQHCRLTPGVPLKPMLAHPTKGVHELFTRFVGEPFTCEWKYDGERAQLHVPGHERAELARAAIFSRNQENNTSKYPDVIGRLESLLKPSVRSCVLDCEAVAYDTSTQQILPFQILSTRKRKDASTKDIKVQVCMFVFDLLYLNGEALVRRPLLERRQLLREHFNTVLGEWEFARGQDCSTGEEVEAELQDAIRGSCEGLMVKALSGARAHYDIATRSHNWLKLKKDYLEGCGDSIDAVVIGGYLGRGRRSGVYGGFLLACYDPDTDSYQSLCKIGTGFSDNDLATLSEDLNKDLIDAPRNYYRFESSLKPDAWFSARCVWEVKCADLSLSPAHHAALGLVDAHKGISLRFPRFIRVRDDKSPEQATSARQISQLYLAQDQVKNSAQSAASDEPLDFY
ncbi:DNA ligase 1 [Leptidea sinapis]|uniref:DNA ligase 1 n=1 Tax=Leptidea sinapis TaxID=189913 RepID=UPI002133C411|nr:DNA ligase 1 [Leptidea sinapis]